MDMKIRLSSNEEHRVITTKEEIVKEIEKKVESIRSGEGDEGRKTVKSHMAFLVFSEGFLERVKEVHLPEIVTEGWELGFYITENSACLYLQLIESDNEGNGYSILETFDLVTMETKMLTVEDYAHMHDVSVVTVRQWIRRGKIRKARKFGSEWRIPEFVEPASGKYQDVIFVWGSNKLTNLPPEYEYLNEYREIAITQADSDTYKAALSNHASSKYRLIRLNTREREKLELWLIGNPFVKSIDGSLDFESFEKKYKNSHQNGGGE